MARSTSRSCAPMPTGARQFRFARAFAQRLQHEDIKALRKSGSLGSFLAKFNLDGLFSSWLTAKLKDCSYKVQNTPNQVRPLYTETYAVEKLSIRRECLALQRARQEAKNVQAAADQREKEITNESKQRELQLRLGSWTKDKRSNIKELRGQIKDAQALEKDRLTKIFMDNPSRENRAAYKHFEATAKELKSANNFSCFSALLLNGQGLFEKPETEDREIQADAEEHVTPRGGQ